MEVSAGLAWFSCAVVVVVVVRRAEASTVDLNCSSRSQQAPFDAVLKQKTIDV